MRQSACHGDGVGLRITDEAEGSCPPAPSRTMVRRFGSGRAAACRRSRARSPQGLAVEVDPLGAEGCSQLVHVVRGCGGVHGREQGGILGTAGSWPDPRMSTGIGGGSGYGAQALASAADGPQSRGGRSLPVPRSSKLTKVKSSCTAWGISDARIGQNQDPALPGPSRVEDDDPLAVRHWTPNHGERHRAPGGMGIVQRDSQRPALVAGDLRARMVQSDVATRCSRGICRSRARNKRQGDHEQSCGDGTKGRRPPKRPGADQQTLHAVPRPPEP